MVFSLSNPSISSNCASNSTSFNTLVASFIDNPSTFGTSIVVTLSSSFSPSFNTSKYGNTSPNICAPIGAATPPPWLIITTQILQIYYLFF